MKKLIIGLLLCCSLSLVGCNKTTEPVEKETTEITKEETKEDKSSKLSLDEIFPESSSVVRMGDFNSNTSKTEYIADIKLLPENTYFHGGQGYFEDCTSAADLIVIPKESRTIQDITSEDAIWRDFESAWEINDSFKAHLNAIVTGSTWELVRINMDENAIQMPENDVKDEKMEEVWYSFKDGLIYIDIKPVGYDKSVSLDFRINNRENGEVHRTILENQVDEIVDYILSKVELV